ncbi:hypothetical protein P4B35_17500 [Pontiellaceae bacterium B12227]|nr:hypothetical protein [Pontiellaceae bacterium B12227]
MKNWIMLFIVGMLVVGCETTNTRKSTGAEKKLFSDLSIEEQVGIYEADLPGVRSRCATYLKDVVSILNLNQDRFTFVYKAHSKEDVEAIKFFITHPDHEVSHCRSDAVFLKGHHFLTIIDNRSGTERSALIISLASKHYQGDFSYN